MSLNRKKDVAIIVVGLADSGKSTFINNAIGVLKKNGFAPIADGLDSCAKTAEGFTVVHPHDSTHRVTLVDTPSFDCCLASQQSQHMTIAGIIFLHEITLGWAAQSAFTTSLCNDALLKNVLLVTTKWGEVDPAIGEKREKDLRNIYWKEMMQGGATMARFEPTLTSTSTILDIILRKPPICVQALKDQRKSLKQSSQKSAKNMKDVIAWLRKAFTGSRQKSQN